MFSQLEVHVTSLCAEYLVENIPFATKHSVHIEELPESMNETCQRASGSISETTRDPVSRILQCLVAAVPRHRLAEVLAFDF